MKLLKRVKFTFLSYGVSHYEIVDEFLKIRWFGIFQRTIPLKAIVRLKTLRWIHRFRVLRDPVDEYRWTRVFFYTNSGFALSLKVQDVAQFIARVKDYAPEAEISALPDIQRDIQLGKGF